MNEFRNYVFANFGYISPHENPLIALNRLRRSNLRSDIEAAAAYSLAHTPSTALAISEKIEPLKGGHPSE